jgi:hypothetical protein
MRMLTIITCRGHISFGAPPLKYYKDKGYDASWKRMSGPAENHSLTSGRKSKFGIHWSSRPRGEIILPFWMLVLPIAAIGAVLLKGQKWRFSLRSLLIAITLIAAALGLLSILI